jgi:Holliday junction resolvasome RuvABC endonuclease subunit
MGDWLSNLLIQWEPNTIILEDIQQQNNVNTFKVLAKLQGVLEYVSKKNNADYYIISPSTWKSNAGVKGKSRVDQKKSAQLIVQQLYNIQATQDECDAILLGKYGIDKVKNNRMVNFES